MRKKFYKLGSTVLALSMAASSVAMPGYLFHKPAIVRAAEETSDELKISDHMQVKADGKELEELQLYGKGVYEAKLNLSEGEHKIQVMKNNAAYKEEKSIVLTEETTVYVRVVNGTVLDSVNNKGDFHTAAWVGNFWGLEFEKEEGTSYVIEAWKPEDPDGELDYMGGGIFCKTFSFKKLAADVTLQDGGYKVALDDKWDTSYGNGSGNIELTIPAGTDKITIFVDTLNGMVYDSVRSGTCKVTQNENSVEYNALSYTVSLIGTARCSSSDWDKEKTGFEFTPISDSEYIFQKTLKAGTYEYKTVFNYDKWYEANGGGNNSFKILKDEQQVIFLYDAKEEKLYDSVTSSDILAAKLGMQTEKVVSKVQDNSNGTTTFITTQAGAGDSVQLVYAPKKDVSNETVVTMKEGKDAKGNFNGTFASDAIYLGDEALDYVFYYKINGTVVLDDTAVKTEVSGKNYSSYQRPEFKGRLLTVPGTFPGKSWDETSNPMTYIGDGYYSYTFHDVPAGNYQFKIATGTWAENYGADGVRDGANYTLAVPEKQDVTIYYNDLTTHRAVTSIDYKFVKAVVTGTGIKAALEDEGLTGIYKVKVPMKAGTYSDLVLAYDGKKFPIDTIVLQNDKEVTFFFDPATGISYNDSTKVAVNKEAVKYDSKDTAYKSQYGAVEEGQKVTFSIDTGNDATRAMLIVKGSDLKNVEMKAQEKDGSRRWSADITFDKYGQYEYFFAVYYGSFVQIYGDDDGFYGTGQLTNLSELKPYDLIVYKKGFHTPDWMKNAIIYQIFPDRFFNGDKKNDKNQISSRGETNYEFVDQWYTLPENPEQETLNPAEYPANALFGDGHWSNEIYGGDLKGITDRIGYLKALGVNVIYLNPVFSSISSHRYDATDYKKIDPILGDLGDFKELVKAAEENDMHIILDGVFNHVSDDSIYFDRYYKFVGQNGKVGAYPYWAYVYDYMKENNATQAMAEEKAKTYFKGKGVTDFSYTQWFQVENHYMKDEKGIEVTDSIGDRTGKPVYAYEGWWGYDSMPVIMSTNGSEYQTGNWAKDVIEGSNSITQYWIRQGSKGWRLDVANEVSDETWQHFRESVKGLNSDAVIIGEIWDDATEYIMGDMYDSVMNYVFRNAVLAYARGGSAEESVKQLERIRERYPQEAFYAMMNLVGSHDTARLLSYLDGVDDDRKQKDRAHAFPSYENTSSQAKQRQYLVALLQMTYAGAPAIYYGDEAGMTGADDPDNRRSMIWGQGNKELVEWYAALANIRSQYEALRTGSVKPVSMADMALMAYERKDAKDTLVVVTNNSGSEKKITYTLPKELGKDGTILYDVISEKEYTVTDGAVSITVPAYRGVILAKERKTINVNRDGLKPAYDEAYKVDGKEEPTEPSPVPSPSKTPASSQSPSNAPVPSAKPVLKPQKIHATATRYTKELGSNPFLLHAKAAGKLTYKSSNPKVVTVEKNGKVKVKGVGKAYITITAEGNKTYAKATKKVEVKVVPRKLKCFLKKKQHSVVISWHKAKEASGYQIEYAENARFTKKKRITIRDNKITSKEVSKWKKKKTYYVRIRAYKTEAGTEYYGAYSTVKKVTM